MKTVKPTRRCKLLLGFLLKGEADAIFKQAPFETENGANPINLWRQSTEAIRRLPDTPSAAGVSLLSASECPVIEEVKARSTYKKHYEAFADYQFALVPVNALLSPQWVADIDYIRELSMQISPDASLDRLVRFAMAEGAITEPITNGAQVLFTSPRRDLHADQVPEVRQVASGEFEIVVRASSRPNYVQVAEIQNRLMLVNGVHKTCALFLQGFSHVPCVLRKVSRIEECGLNMQTSLLRPDLLSSNRPAQVIDFLNDDVASAVNLRSMYQILRVGVGVEVMTVPAVPAFAQAPGSNDINFPAGTWAAVGGGTARSEVAPEVQ